MRGSEEISFGRWEGFTWREIRKTEPEAARDRERGKWTLVPPGGESYVMLAERIRPWVAELAGDNVIVAHGGVARALMHLLAGIPGVQASAAEYLAGQGAGVRKEPVFLGLKRLSAGLPAHLTFPFMNVHPRFRDRLQLSAPS